MAVSLETVKGIYLPYKTAFVWFELASTCIFMFEYLCRLWVAMEQKQFSRPVVGRLRFALQPLLLLDLLVLMTFFAPIDLRFLRIFRITRLLRVLHLELFERSMRGILHSIMLRAHLLGVAAAVMPTAVYCTAALIYMVENPAQPERFSSIPETLWWAVVTLTTIGYGDIYPITPLGKILTSVITLFGVGVFALPAAILTAAVLDVGKRESHECPHCKKQFTK
ncbi:potassium channel family protein [Massilia glaciei]|uniref:potassium channel family protein n=1 Tax=Massilia glaciei TaxID=1524097 RepID=UPI002277342C|nr:potassium channel family protein [Massilia glaciei]